MQRVRIMFTWCLHGARIVRRCRAFRVCILFAFVRAEQDERLQIGRQAALAALDGVEVAGLYAVRGKHAFGIPQRRIEQPDLDAGFNERVERRERQPQLLAKAQTRLLRHLQAEPFAVDRREQFHEPPVGCEGRVVVVGFARSALRHGVAVLQVEHLVIVLHER